MAGLAAFWVAILVLIGGVVGTLQVLGPPVAVHSPAPRPTPVPAVRAEISPPVVIKQAHPAADLAGAHPGRDTPGPVADPDPALEEVTKEGILPRIATDGRAPMQVYSAGFDKTDLRPRFGLLLAGAGLDTAETAQAIKELPGSVTFAFSPYAQVSDKLLSEVRLAEHEYLISIPMEPQSFPLNDPGDKALMTSLAPADNEQRLQWALTRAVGYVGATGALGLMRGERFASVSELMDPVLQQLAARGLLYVDPRPGAKALPFVWQRDVDVVIDDDPAAEAIDAKLAELDKIALEKGRALGLAGAVRPVTLERIAIWANQLPSKGLALAPVSALTVAASPPDQSNP